MSPGEALERNEEHVIHTSQSSLPPCFRHQKPPGPDYLNLARPAARLSGRGDSHTRWRAGRRRSGHVHLLVSLRATHTLADVLRELKSVSSKWAHEEMGVRSFAWQEGYGAFTVSASQLENVRRYIQQQEEHHRTRTFREEYLALLQRSGAEFDERYV